MSEDIAAMEARWERERASHRRARDKRDARIRRLIAYVKLLQADCHYWHTKYKAEAGGMRGEIRRLVDELRAARAGSSQD